MSASIPVPPFKEYDFPPEESASFGQRVTPLTLAPHLAAESPAPTTGLTPDAEANFWSTPARAVESVPPALLVSEAPRHEPSRLRRAAVGVLFGLCLVAVLGLLGFETVSALRVASSSQQGP